MKDGITFVLGMLVMLGLVAVFNAPTATGYEIRQDVPKFQKNTALKALKQSAAWTQMQTQLDQYDTHYVAATNSIAQVTDPKTQTALTKSLKATDDCRDALVKLIRSFQDYVAAND